MLALLLVAALLAPPQDSAVLLVRVLDVSSARIGGDAILVTDSGPGRARHVLIDASDRGDAVVALLRRFRVDTLAAVILSHPHADHYGGLPAVPLPGAAGEAEQGWWRRVHPALLRADVLKAGPHGPSTATTPARRDVVRPQAAVISANARQPPFAGVLALLAARGIPTYCTADAGTITVRVPRAGGWTISAERAAACHGRTMR